MFHLILKVVFVAKEKGVRNSMIDLLITYKDMFVVLHTISFAIGLGAATVHDVAFSNYLSQFDKERWNALAYSICFQLIRSSLLWTLLSGLALFLTDMNNLAQSSFFQFKILLVVIITINSYVFHHLVIPKLANSFWYDSFPSLSKQKQVRRLHRLSFSLGAVSLTSWYSAASLGGLRNLEIGFFTLLGIYIALIGISIGSSYLAESRLRSKLELSSRELLRSVATELLKQDQRSTAVPFSFWEAYRLRSSQTQDGSRERATIN